jgi:2-polyprenyl-3-methyl-5-hydroxy-6-metoxy-1,4-benzoquinol methylase
MTQKEYIEHIKKINTGERMVAEAWTGDISVIHSHFCHWYRVLPFLRKYITTLDIGCGAAYCSRIYTESTVYAIDRPDVIEEVQHINPTPGVVFKPIDFMKEYNLEAWEIIGNVVCIDVLEHLPNPYYGKLLNELNRVSDKDTVFIFSVPIHVDGKDNCSFHCRIWKTKEEFLEEVKKFLPNKKVIFV